MLNTTALAAVSYKQADGVEQYRVYFQAESGALCQAAWKSGTGRWEAVPLRRNGNGTTADAGEPEVKVGTPLSAHVYGSVVGREDAAYEYHVFFLDMEDRIWDLVSADPDDMWRVVADQGSDAMRGDYTAGAFSRLASYGRQCGQECGNASSVVVWQGADEGVWLAGYEPAKGWAAFAMNATVEPRPVRGTAVSIVSLGSDEGVMSVYLNTGSPTRLHFNITDGWALDGGCFESNPPEKPRGLTKVGL